MPPVQEKMMMRGMPGEKSGAPWARALIALTALVSACAGAPWLLGEPLDGKPSIPAHSRAETVADHRRKLDQAHASGQKVIEIAELSALEQRGALHAADEKRFVELLRERAKDWAVLGRPIPLAEDLRHIVALQPFRAQALAGGLRAAQRAAGDLWLAIGENAHAEEEYRRAARLGAERMEFRLRAAWGASPADLDKDVLSRALADLPERVLAPFTIAYLAGGGAQPRLLRRAWIAARVYGPPELQIRIEALPDAAAFTGIDPPTGTIAASDRAGSVPVAPGKVGVTTVGVTVVEPAADERLFGGATLARALLPACAAFPDLTASGPRSRAWSDRLVEEDPTGTDSLELAALLDARTGRLDGAARKLGDLVFYSPDRASGYARAARVWERVGEDRRACLSWERATRFGPVDDPSWCDLLACVRRTPGAGDAGAVARFVQARAPQLPCVAAHAADAGADGGGGAQTDQPMPGNPAFPPDGGAVD